MVICPACGSPARQSMTQYGVRHDHCGLWSWGGAPLVDRKTHEARKVAHACFDALWKQHGYSRSNAYHLLAQELRLKASDCHMKMMDYQTAIRVPGAVRSILSGDDIDLIE